MTTTTWVAVGAAAWAALSVPLGVFIGRFIGGRKRQRKDA